MANGASETNRETRLLSGNQQDVVAEASDGDGGERPVREKLKKTSIASLSQYTNSRANAALQSDELSSTAESQGEQADTTNDASGAMRGRPARKRSFDDLQKGDTQSINTGSHMGVTEEKGSHHKRMRSRDISGDEGMVSNGQPGTEHLEYHDEEENDGDAHRSPGGPGVLVEPPVMTETTPPRTQVRADNNTILSPKKKRSRDQFDKDQDPKDEGSDISGDSIVRSSSEPAENDDPIAQTTSRTATGEPEKKRPRDDELQSEISKTAQEVCCPLNLITVAQPIGRLVYVLNPIYRLNRVLALRIPRPLHPLQHSLGPNLLLPQTHRSEKPWKNKLKNLQLRPPRLHHQASPHFLP